MLPMAWNGHSSTLHGAPAVPGVRPMGNATAVVVITREDLRSITLPATGAAESRSSSYPGIIDASLAALPLGRGRGAG